jgi:hypothetical protein
LPILLRIHLYPIYPSSLPRFSVRTHLRTSWRMTCECVFRRYRAARGLRNCVAYPVGPVCPCSTWMLPLTYVEYCTKHCTVIVS